MTDITLNGCALTLEASGMTRLIDALRLNAGLTGTKEGCGEGECGACTVLIDGDEVLSCLIPVCQVEGRSITTIEGMSPPAGPLDPLQERFIARGAAQCGICTPGMLLTARSLLARNPEPTREAVREGLAGCLCRCTGYQKIIDAVMEAAAVYRQEGSHHDA
jgi:carbon-monoxide dehydrogenase small subunit